MGRRRLTKIELRINLRSRVALKLTYMQRFFTDEERTVLRQTYGWANVSPKPIEMKEISKRLRYSSAASPYRKCGRRSVGMKALI